MERALSVQSETASESDSYRPHLLSDGQFRTLRVLCGLIIPSDRQSGDAVEAGAPEFIDLIASQSLLIELKVVGGLTWLDATCRRLYGRTFVECAARQQREILDIISHKEACLAAPWAGPGVAFFAQVRKLTVDAFFTSKIGIKYLEYIGNGYLTEFSGCPEWG